MQALRHALLVLIVVGFASRAAAQSAQPDHLVYLIGNTASTPPEHLTERAIALKLHLSEQRATTTVVHLGDIAANNGYTDNDLQADTRLDIVTDLGQAANNACFVTGDKDWANSRKNGWETVRKLEKALEKKANNKAVVLPANGCPGPEIVELSDNLVLIAFSSQWWVHPHEKPQAPVADCPYLTPDEVIEELEEAIESATGKNVLLVGHHPLLSNGVYGGRSTLKKHLFPLSDLNPANRVPLPLLGSIYAYYRQNVGTVRDMAHPNYHNMVAQLEKITALHSGLIVAASHDYNLQLNYQNGNYHLISGSFGQSEGCGKSPETQFKSRKIGFSRLEYYPDGLVMSRMYAFENNRITELWADTLFRSECQSTYSEKPVNTHFAPCWNDTEVLADDSPEFPDSTVIAAGPYGGGIVKKALFGTLYRSTWAEPVHVPYLNLDTAMGGLTPVARGGGRQTTSLKLIANDGREYVFRSVDKDPIKALSPELRNTIVTPVVRDMTATQHPYGAIPVSYMLDNTNILHARPRLYVLPDHPSLGVFQRDFAGLFGMLEERPYDPRKGTPRFYGAADVTRSVRLFRKLYKDNKVRIDAHAFARARVFDLLIGDWGRHEDNWKWAGYKENGSWVYRPIPRDRDHAFSQWDGLLPWLADRKWARPNTENFGKHFRDIRSMTWQNRHYDRFLLTSLSRNDWQEAAQEILSQVTDSVIRASLYKLPPEVMDLSGYEVGRKLIRRRIELKEAVDIYYRMLAREVSVVGSNKREYFQVERHSNGSVTVRVYDQNKENEPKGDPFFERTFRPKETREIRLFGLDGKDRFELTGNAKSSIRVRIIGGYGTDLVNDQSTVKGLRKHTVVYDEPNGVTVTGTRETRSLLRDDPLRNHYDRTAFKYNTYLPLPLILFNQDDGLGGGLSWQWTRQKWGKPDFASRYTISAVVTENQARYTSVKGRWRHVLGSWDAHARVDGGDWFPYYRFYGVGNTTTIDESRDAANGYRARYRGISAAGLLQHRLLRKGSVSLGPLLERYETGGLWGPFSFEEVSVINQFRHLDLFGAQVNFDINLLDRKALPFRGIRVKAQHQHYGVAKASGRFTLDTTPGETPTAFGITTASAAWYGTVRVGLPFTLGIVAGGTRVSGDGVPFYKMPTLGQTNNLRGYVRNRFSGDASLYINHELRAHLGVVRNPVLPFELGALAFYDTGKVWWQGNDGDRWHAGYGGGLYIAPISLDYLAISATLESSEENPYLVRLAIGLPVAP